MLTHLAIGVDPAFFQLWLTHKYTFTEPTDPTLCVPLTHLYVQNHQAITLEKKVAQILKEHEPVAWGPKRTKNGQDAVTADHPAADRVSIGILRRALRHDDEDDDDDDDDDDEDALPDRARVSSRVWWCDVDGASSPASFAFVR